MAIRKALLTPPPPTQLIAAGDIADTGAGTNTAGTAALVQRLPRARVQTLGDNAYPDGAQANVTAYYAPTWGPFLARTKAAVGNHDWWAGGLSANGRLGSPNSVDYFGGVAPDGTNGYYTYDLNALWSVVVLNSENGLTSTPTGICARSTQEVWLRTTLVSLIGRRVIVVWHRPRYTSSSAYPPQTDTFPFWKACADFGVALVLSGHAHNYERFSGQDGVGIAAAAGTVQICAGTGGTALVGFSASQPNSAARYSTLPGVVVLTPTAAGYAWKFVSTDGAVQDSGTTACVAIAYPTVYDTFTGTDATAMTAHTPDHGGAWTNLAGTGQITSNTARGNSLSWYGVVDSALADVNVSCQINLGTDDTVTREIGLVLRATDTNNRVICTFIRDVTTGSSRITLVKRVASVDTNIVSNVTVTTALNTVYTLTVVAKGSAYAVYMDDVLKISTSDAFNSSATKHGITVRTANAPGAFIDTFAVTAAS